MTDRRKGLLAIIGGTALGQLITLAAAPILARLYSPADFGVFTVFSSLILIAGTVAALRFELAIPVPTADRGAFGLAALGLISTAITLILGLIAVWVFGEWLADSLDQAGLMPWLWLVPVTASLIGAYAVYSQLAIRQRRYSAIARRNITQQVSTVIVQLVCGIGRFGPAGLIVGIGVGQGIGALSLSNGCGMGAELARRAITLRKLKGLLLRYRRFPLIMTPSGLLNVLGIQLPVILIAYWYGSEVAGWLGLTQRVLALPVTLLGISVAQVYLGELAREVRSSDDRSRQLFLMTSRRLALIGVCTAVPVVVLAPWAFSLVFGSSWTESGLYAQAFAVSLAAQLVASPLSQTLMVFERQGIQLCWDAGRLVLTSSAIWLCGSLGVAPLRAIWILSLMTAGAYAVSWLTSWFTVSHRQPRSVE